MTTDQIIQICIAAGTWAAAIATVGAVVVALWLARRSAAIRLRTHAGLRIIIRGDGSPPEEHVSIGVTNLSERPVTVNTVGWQVGRRKSKRFAIMPVAARSSNDYPLELAYGKSADFMVSFRIMPDWTQRFASEFVRDVGDRNLRTLKAMINTSVGETILVTPEAGFLARLKQAHAGA